MLRVIVMVLLLSRMSGAEDPAKSVLTAIRDAQKSQLSRYSEGILVAKCSDLNKIMKTHNLADVHLEWQGESAYWKYTLLQLDSVTGETKSETFTDRENLISNKQFYSYSPTAKYFSASPVGRFNLTDQMLDVRPAKVWYCVLPVLSDRTWYDYLSDVINSGLPTNFKLDDRGIATWKSTPDELLQYEMVFDMNRGGNVTLYDMAPQTGPGQSGIGFRCTFTWMDDGSGGFRLKKLVMAQFRKVVSDPERLIEVEILSFNPKPKFTSGRFTRDSIRLPQGTEIATFDAVPGSHPKVSRIGGPVKRRLSDKELEDLAKGLKDQGFSNPSRNTKPR